MPYRARSPRRRDSRIGRRVRRATLNVRTAAWLLGCFRRAVAADARRTLRRHGLAWR